MRLEKKKYETSKLLPHITEEYHFRITNHLLLKKILSPKRDKLIVSSLENVNRKSTHGNRHSHAASVKLRSMKKFKSMHHLKNNQNYSDLASIAEN